MDRAERNRKLGAMSIIAGAALILAAASLTIFNLWDESRAKKSAETVLGEILDAMEAEDKPTAAPVPEAATEGVTGGTLYTPPPPIPTGAPLSGWSRKAQMPSVRAENEDFVGVLEIPKLSLALPVGDTWSYPRLRKTPCRYTGGTYTSDMVIAGHNYNSHFGRLKELQPNDEVFFTDMDGNRFDYLVSETETLAPTAIDEMTQVDGWALTLFTCTLGGRSRVTVRCKSAEERETQLEGEQEYTEGTENSALPAQVDGENEAAASDGLGEAAPSDG